MIYIITKYLITAGIIVIATELAKSSDKIGAIIIALPLMTLLTLIWLQIEGASIEKISNHAYYTFWYVIPTLPMFFIFPNLIKKYGFWEALGISAIFTILLFFIYALILKKIGINLFP